MATKQESGNRRTYLYIGAAVFAVLIVFLILRPQWGAPEKTPRVSPRRALNSLYSEALEDAKQGKLLDSLSKLNQIENIRPGFKDAKKRLAAAKAKVIAGAKEDVAAGRANEAKEDLERLDKIDPDNQEADKILKDIEKDETALKPSGPTRLDDENATAASIVPDNIDGYETANNWDNGSLAGAAYEPIGETMRREISSVLLTVGKLGNEEAARRLEKEKGLFPDEAVQLQVNGVTAHSGMSGGVLALTWTMKGWFFAVQVVPNQSVSIDFIRGVALDVNQKLDL